MAQSGVSVDDACVLAFESMKSKRAYKYVTFKVSVLTYCRYDMAWCKQRTYFLPSKGIKTCYLTSI